MRHRIPHLCLGEFFFFSWAETEKARLWCCKTAWPCCDQLRLQLNTGTNRNPPSKLRHTGPYIPSDNAINRSWTGATSSAGCAPEPSTRRLWYKVTLTNKGSALPALNYLPVLVQKKEKKASGRINDNVGDSAVLRCVKCSAQHSYDLVWLSCYVSITITHIASSESAASSRANPTNRLATRGWTQLTPLGNNLKHFGIFFHMRVVRSAPGGRQGWV